MDEDGGEAGDGVGRKKEKGARAGGRGEEPSGWGKGCFCMPQIL